MGKERGAGVKDINLQYKVPILTWLRLRHYAGVCGYSMPDACNKALNSGFDAIGIPRSTAKLLGERKEEGE